jgi:tRNA-dihydrouridine synthase
MNNVWKNLPKPFFALAPMEGVTDTVFRHVIMNSRKPDLFFTEFTNASSFCSEKGRHSTRQRLAFSDDEHPLIAQIWGKHPDEFAQMARELASMGFDGIDINMGCPDKNVVKTGGGSALIRSPELAAKLIQSAKTGGLPVSVKTRLADVSVAKWPEWTSFLLKQDIANLTVHLRTRKEMSKVNAHYELIEEIVKLRDEISPNTLITINGDIDSREKGEQLARDYGVDGIMVGRGVFQNPFIFDEEPREHDKSELIELLRLHLDLHDEYESTYGPRKFDPLKRFFKMYIRDFPGASELRDQLMHSGNTAEAREILDKQFN